MFIHKGVLPANQACMNLIQPFTGVDKPKQADSMYETDLFRCFWGFSQTGITQKRVQPNLQ